MEEIKGKVIIAYKKPGAKSKCPSAEDLSQMYSVMTAKEIAKQLNVSKNTVRAWIYRIRKGVNENG